MEKQNIIMYVLSLICAFTLGVLTTLYFTL